MAKRKYRKKKKEVNLKVNPELSGFDIKINPFGEIQSNYKVDEINQFLNRNLEDKKLNQKEKKSGKQEKKKDKE